jgi:hypothetical protein
MEFSIQYLSFFVIQTAGNDQKTYKHYQTLDELDYQQSEIKHFLDDEFAKISKRKVDRNPNSENAPTKIGRFIVEPDHDLTSNPNYNLFGRLRQVESKEQFLHQSDEMVRLYMDTSAVRGGALIIAQATLNKYFDEPFIFMMKCDFESKIARISDEKSLISRVEMAISAKNMKSIQYPHMPEEGMLEEYELKIHQATHARYFEDFLKYVSYEKPMPEIVNEQVIHIVQQYIEDKWNEEQSDERQQEEQGYEIWAASEKRELQQKWSQDQVVEATRQIIEHNPDLELKFKLDGITIRGNMADYGSKINIARLNGKYVVLLEGDSFQFDKNVSPIELLNPNDFHEVVQQLNSKSSKDDKPPWD